MGTAWKIPGARPDDSLWWQAEGVYRKVAGKYQERKALKNEARQDLQRSLLEREKEGCNGNTGNWERDALSGESLNAHKNLLENWALVLKIP